MTFLINQLKKEEFKEYFKIREDSLEEYQKMTGKKIGYNKKSIKKELENLISSKNRCVLLAKDNGKMAGFIIGTKINNLFNKFGYIDDLFISKNFRRRGIATLLIEGFVDYLKNEDIMKLRLGVSIKNRNALKFYKKAGFKIDYYEMEKLIK
jgi:ribosomal protein S18 acetylase RimI-like enzyme